MADIFPRQIADQLWLLGNEYFHIYLIKSDIACALVETGISATADILRKQLSSIGAKPDWVIVTHPHSDHVTGLDYLKQDYPWATVIAGKGAEAFINHPKSMQSMIIEDRFMTDFMITHGLSSYKKMITSVPSISGCRLINDGEEANLGNLTIRFLEVKGHSPGNILVYVPGINALLASDSLGHRYPNQRLFPTFFTGFTEYWETIDRLEEIDPVILGLAHNGFFSGRQEVRGIFKDAKKAALDVKTYIINSKSDDEEIVQNLFQYFYIDELKISSPQNILNCCRLLVRRVRELYKSNTDICGK